MMMPSVVKTARPLFATSASMAEGKLMPKRFACPRGISAARIANGSISGGDPPLLGARGGAAVTDAGGGAITVLMPQPQHRPAPGQAQPGQPPPSDGLLPARQKRGDHH